jgi:hypothetical protein
MVVSLLTTDPIGEHHYARPVVVPAPPRADAANPQTTSPWRTVFSVTARASTNWSR